MIVALPVSELGRHVAACVVCDGRAELTVTFAVNDAPLHLAACRDHLSDVAGLALRGLAFATSVEHLGRRELERRRNGTRTIRP